MTVHAYSLKELVERSGGSIAELEKVLEAIPPIGPEGPWLAGGALRRVVLGQALDSDFDFFFASEAQCSKFCVALLDRKFKIKTTTDHAVTYTGKVEGVKRDVLVQVIKIAWYANAEAVLDSFDFTLCMFAYDGATLTVGEFALYDAVRRRLAVHRITFATASVRRLMKYADQGFTVCEGAIRKLLETVVANPGVVQSEVEYVD